MASAITTPPKRAHTETTHPPAPPAGTPPPPPPRTPAPAPPAPPLFFVAVRFAPALSRREELPAGVFAGSLAEALTRIPGEIEPWLGQQASFAEHAFVALNTAFFTDGAFLWLPRGALVERPIHL